MVDRNDLRDARRLTTEHLGEALVDFNQMAKDAEEEAKRLEIKAESLRCDAKGFRKEAERILKERCPFLSLSHN